MVLGLRRQIGRISAIRTSMSSQTSARQTVFTRFSLQVARTGGDVIVAGRKRFDRTRVEARLKLTAHAWRDFV